MLSKVFSSNVLGVDSNLIGVEVDINRGLPSFSIVGLADTAIIESRERVRSAVKNSGFFIEPKKVIINLSPAGIKKEGPAFDLPIAVGILKSYGFIENVKHKDYMIVGELSLSGEIKLTKGIINSVICAKENNFKGIIIPKDNLEEASIIENIEIIPVETLKDVVNFLNNNIIKDYKIKNNKIYYDDYKIDFKDVKGQTQAKRAMEISAAGGHNLYIVGSPGAGKSMLSKRLPTILPKLNQDEIIECTKIYSGAGMLSKSSPIISKRPFRSPHHSSSTTSIIGGGRSPKAGEISLAHKGVLFFDEANEFKRAVLETLRQPLEDKVVSITRVNYRIEIPCDFIFIMASNPCPCGYLFEENMFNKKCTCSKNQIDKYKDKLSGPILDRIDLYTEIRKLSKEELMSYETAEPSGSIRSRVEIARNIQYKRFKSSKTNSLMNQSDIRKYCTLDKNCVDILSLAIDRLGVSGRGYDKILKVARTIADLDENENILEKHLMEAISFRKK